MAILHHGAYSASFYNLPNTLVGSYKSPGISVKTPCTKFQFRCSLDIPINNVINIDEHPNGLKFCGMMLEDNGSDENFNHGFVEYDLIWQKDQEENLLSYKIMQKYYQVEQTNEGDVISPITLDVTSSIPLTDNKFAYSPCSFIIYFDFVIGEKIKTVGRSFQDFRFDEISQKYCLKEELDLEGQIPSALTYRIDFMTNDDEKTFYIDDIEIIGNMPNSVDMGETKEREGFLICDLPQCLAFPKNPEVNEIEYINAIKHISYAGKVANNSSKVANNSSIEVRSKIYNSQAELPSPCQLRWSDPYLKTQNKVILKDDKIQNTGTSEGEEGPTPFRIYYNPAAYFSQSKDNEESIVKYTLQSQYSSLILHGGVVLRNPEFISNQNRHYSERPGDTNKDGFINSADVSLMPPLGVKLGDKEYVEAMDLVSDGVITEDDFDVIYNSFYTKTSLGGGYISIKLVAKENENEEIIGGPFYIYEEGDYKIDLEPYNQNPNVIENGLYIDIYFNRYEADYISPYISLLGIVTTNEYSSKIQFGPTSQFQAIISGDQVDQSSVDNRVIDPTYIYYSADETGENQEEKRLEASELPFTLPYWYSFENTPNAAQNIFSLIMDERFAEENPQAKIYLEVDLSGNQEVYKGGNIKRLRSNLQQLSGGDIIADHEEYRLIDANQERKVVRFICLLDSKETSFDVTGVCSSSKIDDPSTMDFTQELVSDFLPTRRDYKYKIEIGAPKEVHLVEEVPPAEQIPDESDPPKSILITNLPANIYYYSSANNQETTYTVRSKTFNGVINAGGSRNHYKRTIFTHEIPGVISTDWSIACNTLKKAEDEIKKRLSFSFNEDIQKYLQYTYHFDNVKNGESMKYTLRSIEVSSVDTPSLNERATDLIDLVSDIQTLQLAVMQKQDFSYKDLSHLFGATINEDTIFSLENLTDNTKLSYMYTPKGITIEGRELYNFREDWIPKLKSGYYHVNTKDYFYNTQRKTVRIPQANSLQYQINTTNGVSGKAGIIGQYMENLMPTIAPMSVEDSGKDYAYTIFEINAE